MAAEFEPTRTAVDPDYIFSAFGQKLTPECRTVSNALITEAQFDRGKGIYTGAVYDGTGALAIESLRAGSMIAPFRPVDPVSIDTKSHTADTVFREAIYGGHFFYTWGHFLIETVSSAAMASKLPEVPVIFSPWGVTSKSSFTESFKKHVMPILRASGWNDREIIISSGAIQSSKLHVPLRLTAFGVRFATPSMHHDLALVYDRIRNTIGGALQKSQKVVATRSSDHRRWHPSEAAIYSLLADKGFRTISPQHMSAADQIALFSATDTLVAFSGSILHNSVFMQPGSHVIEIGDDARRSAANWIQIDMCNVCKQNHNFVPGFDTAPRTGDAIVKDIISVSAS